MKAKNIFGVAITLLMAMCFVSVVMAKDISFDKNSYTVVRGNNLNIQTTLECDEMNTTENILNISYPMDIGNMLCAADPLVYWFNEDDITNLTDFDSDTSILMTNSRYELVSYDAYGDHVFWMTIEPITNFDGIWIMKSAGMSIDFIDVMNNTNGEDTYGTLEYNSNDISFGSYSNTTYKFCDAIDVDGTDYTVSDYVDNFGAIDKITLYVETVDGGGMLLSGKSKLFYEFHLFNTPCAINDYAIVNEANISMAWAVSYVEATESVYVFTITVPITADIGAYNFYVYACGEINHVVINVQSNQNNVYTWAYAIIPIMIGVGLIGVADFVMDTKTNPITVVGLTAVGIVLIAVGVMVATDIQGWTSFGFLG